MTEFQKPRIWFALDEDGEPHEKNPDDGYGGHLIKSIEHVREFYKNEPITTPEHTSDDEDWTSLGGDTPVTMDDFLSAFTSKSP